MTQLKQPGQDTGLRSSKYYTLSGVNVRDHFISCPLDYKDSSSRRHISIYARELSRLDNHLKLNHGAPILLYLQGGPGFECSSIIPSYSGMLKQLLDRYIVIMLDQRGTGLSTPLDAETLRLEGSIEDQCLYCQNFRADSIVRDCEMLRNALVGSRKDRSWTLLGQSFGGFCAFTYLSHFPDSLRAVITTGGVPPVAVTNANEVYALLIHKLIHRNKLYYAQFSEDIIRIRNIVNYLDCAKLKSLNGGNLSSRRFRQIGIDLGMHGGFERIHNIVQRADNDLAQFGLLTYKTRETLEQSMNFDGNPIYSLLHESIYCQAGHSSMWAAQRVVQQYTEFDVAQDAPIYLYGEMIFDWMFEDYAHLRTMRGLATQLATVQWPNLYRRDVLAHQTVPLAAAVYIEDMYVHVDHSLRTLDTMTSARDLVTNRYLHNALRHVPEEILPYLFRLIQELSAQAPQEKIKNG